MISKSEKSKLIPTYSIKEAWAPEAVKEKINNGVLLHELENKLRHPHGPKRS